MMELPDLRRLRQKRSWSQNDLSQRSGVGVSTIIRLERGEGCRYVTARKLAEALSVPVEEVARPIDSAETGAK